MERSDEELSALKAQHPHRDFPGIIHESGFWNAILEPNPVKREELAEEWALDETGFRKASDRREVGVARTYKQLLELGQKRGYRCAAGWARHVMAARS